MSIFSQPQGLAADEVGSNCTSQADVLWTTVLSNACGAYDDGRMWDPWLLIIVMRCLQKCSVYIVNACIGENPRVRGRPETGSPMRRSVDTGVRAQPVPRVNLALWGRMTGIKLQPSIFKLGIVYYQPTRVGNPPCIPEWEYNSTWIFHRTIQFPILFWGREIPHSNFKSGHCSLTFHIPIPNPSFPRRNSRIPVHEFSKTVFRTNFSVFLLPHDGPFWFHQ